jgi:hypothetical protein
MLIYDFYKYNSQMLHPVATLKVNSSFFGRKIAPQVLSELNYPVVAQEIGHDLTIWQSLTS